MERYQRGHQQPVEGERPIGVLLVFACLVVAIAAVLWGLNAARQQRPGAAFDSGSDSAVASQKDEMRDADDSDVAVTAQTFLRALDKRSGTATDSPEGNAIAVRLAWSEDRPMTESQAVKNLAVAQSVSRTVARRRLEAAGQQLDQDGEEYTVQDCYSLALDFFAAH